MSSTTRRAALASIDADNAPAAHAGLWLDKYPFRVGRDDKEWKRKLVAETAVNEGLTSGAGTGYEQFFRRWWRALEGYGAHCREATVRGRMIVGLGAEGVLETSVALHRTYGVPYIPGSALKGLARHFATEERVEGWTQEHSRVVFGDEKRDGTAGGEVSDENSSAGYVTFFDALYVPGSGAEASAGRSVSRIRRGLHPDVMTPHHPDYYMDGGDVPPPPADWDDPSPVPFLSATGRYLVALCCEHEGWVEPTFALLRLALAEAGVGAKTSSGYGRLELPEG